MAQDGMIDDESRNHEGIVDDRTLEGLDNDRICESIANDRTPEGLDNDRIRESIANDRTPEGLDNDRIREKAEQVSKKRVVIALGGNALGKTLPEQMIAVKSTAKAICDLIEEDYQVIITHGNGPQVGMIHNAMSALSKEDSQYPIAPLSVCVAMSQAYIGYDLQNALREELLNRHLPDPGVVTMITQILVNSEDPAFLNPEKPIGKFLTKEQADLLRLRYGYCMKEDSGRGYRRVVASPKPVKIIEIGAIRSLVDSGQLVIACGGGGIPVMRNGNHLKGAPAVIDKDFASALLAKELNADMLIILTAVEKVAIHFGSPAQQDLSALTISQAKEYAAAGHFAAGSMLPKVLAAIDFASSSPDRTSLITMLSKAREGIKGLTGTRIRG